MSSAQDVAAAIIERSGELDQLQLQKFLYYVQGWSQAWQGTPIFPEDIEAWRYGPAVDNVYQVYKYHGQDLFCEPEQGDAGNLSDNELAIVDAVVSMYGSTEGVALSKLTHEDQAWREAWERRSAASRGRQRIDPESIAASLLEAGARSENRAPRPLKDIDGDVMKQAVTGEDPASFHEVLEQALGAKLIPNR